MYYLRHMAGENLMRALRSIAKSVTVLIRKTTDLRDVNLLKALVVCRCGARYRIKLMLFAFLHVWLEITCVLACRCDYGEFFTRLPAGEATSTSTGPAAGKTASDGTGAIPIPLDQA